MTSLLQLPIRLEQRRRSIGMSKKVLATRAGISLPTVNRILSGKEKRLAITNIEAIARALSVVIQLGATIGFEEIESGHELRKKQAALKAMRIVKMVQGTMALEAQAVEPSRLQEMIEQTTCELLAGSPHKLWKD